MSPRLALVGLVLAACETRLPSEYHPDEPPEDPWADWPTGDTEVACADLPGGSEIALDSACVTGACLGMSLAELEAVLGPAEVDGDAARWEGVESILAEDAAIELAVVYPFDGASPDGLGLGAPLDCFADALGDPDIEGRTAYEHVMVFDYLGLLVRDITVEEGGPTEELDGEADQIVLR